MMDEVGEHMRRGEEIEQPHLSGKYARGGRSRPKMGRHDMEPLSEPLLLD